MSPLEPIAYCLATIGGDTRHARSIVTRPHPLLCVVERESRLVLVTAAASWNEAREALLAFATQLAEAKAMLILLGRPREPDLGTALEKGLASLLSETPTADELF